MIEKARPFLAGNQPKTGRWTRIEANVRFGRNVELGHWSVVGAGSVVSDDSRFGHWASIGRNVTLGRGCILGSHATVQDGLCVSDGTTLGDNDVLTSEGIRRNAFGGHVSGGFDGYEILKGCFGIFLLPGNYDDEIRDGMLNDYRFGRGNTLELCRIDRAPRDDTEALKMRDLIQERLKSGRDPDPDGRDAPDLTF